MNRNMNRSFDNAYPPSDSHGQQRIPMTPDSQISSSYSMSSASSASLGYASANTSVVDIKNHSKRYPQQAVLSSSSKLQQPFFGIDGIDTQQEYDDFDYHKESVGDSTKRLMHDVDEEEGEFIR